VYNGVTLDFTMPVSQLALQRRPVRGQNISLAGSQETLYFRAEQTVALFWQFLPYSMGAPLRAYVDTWGLLGKQAVLTLDRYFTASDQEEYFANQLFTKAELLNDPFDLARSVQGRAVSGVTLRFRQGL